MKVITDAILVETENESAGCPLSRYTDCIEILVYFLVSSCVIRLIVNAYANARTP